MRSTLFIVLCCGLVGLLGSCKKHLVRDPSDLTVVQKMLVKSDNELAFGVLRGLDASNNGNNFTVCPPDLGNTMGMLISGADGSTRAALQQAMGLSTLSTEDINQGYKDLSDRMLAIDDANISYVQGNSIWYQSGTEIKPAFEQLNQVYYSAGILSANFQDSATQGTMNEWASAHSRGKAPALNPPIGASNHLMAAGAAEFMAPFSMAFNPDNTQLLPFVLSTGATVHAPTMFETNLTFWHYTDNTVQVADLPYGNGNFCLTVVMPQAGVSMQELLANLTNDKWLLWLAGLDSSNTYMLRLPKVELSNPVSMAGALSDMGLSAALNSTASYANLCGSSIKPDAVLQASYLKVSETGLVAAPSTNTVTPPPNRTMMAANKPFLLAVREKATGAILMLAEVNNPFGH